MIGIRIVFLLFFASVVGTAALDFFELRYYQWQMRMAMDQALDTAIIEAEDKVSYQLGVSRVLSKEEVERAFCKKVRQILPRIKTIDLRMANHGGAIHVECNLDVEMKCPKLFNLPSIFIELTRKFTYEMGYI